MRIRFRLALFGALVAALAMLVFAVLIAALIAAAAPDEQDKALTELVETAAADLAASPELVLPSQPPVQVDLAAGNDAYVAILDPRGRALYSTGQLQGDAPSVPAAVVVEALQQGSSSAVFTTAGIEFNVQARSWERGDDTGVIIAGQSTAVVDEQVEGLTTLFWVVGIITAVAASIVGWVVAGRALRPLRRLATTTEEIRNTGDLSARLPAARNAKDEVGVLTASFNGMLDGLQSTRQELSEALAAQRRFVADASHELRSPLTTIRNNAEFLVERPEADSTDRQEALGDIVAEGERMSHLVSDLLLLAQADAGRVAEPQAVDFGAVAEEAVRRRPGLSFNSSAPAVVMGDEAALSRLVVILLDNALKHGGGEATVSVSAGDESVSMEVADTGPGIATDDIDKLFDRFYRGDPARSAPGYGLGLAIAKEIASSHGGTVTAANGPRGGAVFSVTLPKLLIDD